MKSKLAALAACLLLGGFISVSEAQVARHKRCVIRAGIPCCLNVAPCHCVCGSSVVNPQVVASWCRDRGPTC